MKRVESKFYDSTTRRYELVVYAILWLLVFILPFLNESVRFVDGRNFSWFGIIRWFVGLIPFIVIFLVHNFILVPRFLARKRVRSYIISLLFLVIAFVGYQDISYAYRIELMTVIKQHLGEVMSVKPRKNIFLGMNMPIVLNFSLLLLMMALNGLIMMVFKYINERDRRQAIEHSHLQDEIKFLKAQINPHFFMNMLNSIHAMIDLDPMKAQELTIELSRMMRYILYGDPAQKTTLAEEIKFIESYMSLMRQRYPESKVGIRLDVPAEPSKEFMVSPLLYVTFIENAFKHGVSYQKFSLIEVRLVEDDGKVLFECVNTKVKDARANVKGIGLQNAIRRLDLLYGYDYSLKILDGDEMYTVKLIIPSL